MLQGTRAGAHKVNIIDPQTLGMRRFLTTQADLPSLTPIELSLNLCQKSCARQACPLRHYRVGSLGPLALGPQYNHTMHIHMAQAFIMHLHPLLLSVARNSMLTVHAGLPAAVSQHAVLGTLRSSSFHPPRSNASSACPCSMRLWRAKDTVSVCVREQGPMSGACVPNQAPRLLLAALPRRALDDVIHAQDHLGGLCRRQQHLRLHLRSIFKIS